MKTVLIILAFICINGSLFAQSAEDYFHTGAQFYIHGKEEQALSAVNEGLTKLPNDEKLQELKELLMKEKEENQQQDQEQQQDQNQEQQEQDQQQGEQDQQDQGQQQEQQQPQEAQQMSKEEIEKLLETLRYQEDKLIQKLQKEKAKKGKQRNPEKDW